MNHSFFALHDKEQGIVTLLLVFDFQFSCSKVNKELIHEIPIFQHGFVTSSQRSISERISMKSAYQIITCGKIWDFYDKQRQKFPKSTKYSKNDQNRSNYHSGIEIDGYYQNRKVNSSNLLTMVFSWPPSLWESSILLAFISILFKNRDHLVSWSSGVTEVGMQIISKISRQKYWAFP